MRQFQDVAQALQNILRRRSVIFLLLLGVALLLSKAPQTTAAGTSACFFNAAGYFDTLPNGARLSTIGGCATCHISTNSLYPFGTDYANQPIKNLGVGVPGVSGGDAHSWTPALAFLDSSGTGYTNGEKLQDPTGTWIFGTANPGITARVVDPHSTTAIPFQPTLNAFSISSGATYQGTIDLTVGLTTQIGARKVVYDILNGATVIKSYTKQTDALSFGGYTNLDSTFFLTNWDTNDIPNGTYTIRATLYDALAASLGGPRTHSISRTNVTINNPVHSLRYVAPGGLNTGTCTTAATPCATLDYTVLQAQNNDELRLAAGTYTPGSGAALTIDKHITIRGGYTTSNWTTPDRTANVTILDGQHQHSVLAFTATASGFTVKDLTIRNGSGSAGGGATVSGAQGTFNGVTFANNTATGNGGGLALDSTSTAILRSVSFLNNTAGGTGGGLYAQSNVTITNALFANNTASNGAAITLNGPLDDTISYATIAGNAAPSEAIRLQKAGGLNRAVLLQNVLISGYAVGVNIPINQAVDLTLDHVLVANTVATPTTNNGSGSVTGNPLSGVAGYTNVANGDYHLAFGAPAIDAGLTVSGVLDDRDGQPRPFGSAPDIGAYEFQGPEAAISFDDITMAVTQPANVVSVMLNLSIPSLAPVKVSYTTSDDTAVAGKDYQATSGTVTFVAGQTSQAFDIPILNPQSTTLRTFVVTLTSPNGALLTSLSSATVTILPPADPPRIAITASTPIAHRDGVIPGVFTITRDVGVASPLVVHYTVSGTAVAGVDYAALSGDLIIPAGQYETTLLITPIGGSANRLVNVILTPDPTYLLGRSSATIQIVGILSWRTYLPLTLR